MEKEQAKKQITSFSPVIMEHLIKLLTYSTIRPNDTNGWIHTVAHWLHQADDITVKPHARKLKERDLMQSLFSCMGDDVRDYERALHAFLADNLSGKFNYNGKESYPEFVVTNDLAQSLMKLCQSVIESTVPMLLDKKDHSTDEYFEVVYHAVTQVIS